MTYDSYGDWYDNGPGSEAFKRSIRDTRRRKMIYTKEEILRMANEELEQEDIEKAVQREKQKIVARRERPWWQKLMPFKITIARW